MKKVLSICIAVVFLVLAATPTFAHNSELSDSEFEAKVAKIYYLADVDDREPLLKSRERQNYELQQVKLCFPPYKTMFSHTELSF